ncbi:MAG: LysR substrate-binding domain-containing protein, partial [Bacteriovoracaceae bacterium]
FYLFVAQDHPLSKRQTIKEEDLDINEIWLLNKGNCFRDQILSICAKTKDKNLTNPINFESGNFETLKNMVLSGTGYTVLPQMAIKQLPEGQQKLVRQFAPPVPTREVSLVHMKDCVKQKILNVLEEEILASVPDELREISQNGQEIVEIS